MQKQSFQHLPILYRPYDFPASYPVLAFIGSYWKNTCNVPEFLHFHNAIEVGYCLDGSGQIYWGESDCFSCRSGDYCIIFPQVPHIVVNDSVINSWEYLYVEPKLFLQKEGFSCDLLWQIFYIPQKVPVVVSRDKYPLLHLYISKIFREFHEKKILYQRAVHGLLIAFLAEINRITLRGSADGGYQKETVSAYKYICTALEYIYEHYAEPVSIRELAAHCCISESHFRRLFKNSISVSPLEYIQHYRIQQACHLIYLNQAPLNLIAQQVGYRSLSSFNRQFQQYMHVSPTQYRREHLYKPLYNEVLSYDDITTRHIFRI